MKPRSLILFLIPLFFSLATTAQVQKKLSGSWEGRLNIGSGLRIIFHFKENNTGGISASVDSPDQSAYGLKCDTVILSEDNVKIEMHNLKAIFSGKLTTDSTLDGTFSQAAVYPLLLRKGIGKLPPLKRPQTPQSPFPYKSEDVEYDNADKTLHYGATLTIPAGKAPFPAAVLVTGSGAQDRDEELAGHKLFAVLADALTRNGIVVLRVDDRGVGKSSGIFAKATTEDFATDVNASLNYLLARPEVDKKKTGLIGHSEGGMIVPMVAAYRTDIDFLVLLAAPGIKIDALMVEQNAAILRSAGISQPAIDAYRPLYIKLMREIITAPDTIIAAKLTLNSFQQWKPTVDSNILKELSFDSEENIQNVTTLLVQAFSSKWFKYFLAFDPQLFLQQLNCKVLALNGDKDIQVIATSNLAGIQASLKKSKVKKYTIETLPGLNHLFQTCKSCTLQEYGELEETFSPSALLIINNWLNKYVK